MQAQACFFIIKNSFSQINIIFGRSHQPIKSIIMSFVLVPILLTVVFIGYILYLLIIKKDRTKLRAVLFPGLFFILVWIAFYYFLLR